MQNTNHMWSFSIVGGVKRVNFETGKDLVELYNLDQKLWTALSCPVYGLDIDDKTLELIDTDNDGRIRVPEVIAAVDWITSVIKNPDELLEESAVLNLSSINEKTDLGATLLASANKILQNIGLEASETISVNETSDMVRIFADTKFNGDGIITEISSDNERIKKTIKDIIACMGSVEDRNGKDGINEEITERFYNEAKDYSDWYAQAETNAKTIFPFGENTEKASNIYNQIKSKIDDYFVRCNLAEFDAESAKALNILTSKFTEIADRDLSECSKEIALLPVAKVETECKYLNITKGINPAWAELMSELVELVIKQVFPNKQTINESEWKSIGEILKAYHQWKENKKGASVEAIGLERVRQICQENDKANIFELINQDKALKNEANNIILVDKLVRFYRDIFRLLKNFVTFYDFYAPNKTAIFQAGQLFIDQRCCRLCIRVNDMGKHNVMANFSGMFLIYCDCVSKKTKEKMTIVAAMTNGDIDNLIVGKNAIFYDTKGQDWDATVIKIIDNPISIRQAFWSPYRKFSKFIEEQVNKIASQKDKEVYSNTTANIEKTGNTSIEEKAKAPAQPFDIGKFVGIFAAIGLAIGAIGGVLASFLAGFLSLVWWKMPLAVVGIIIAISGPSMILAWLKLRKRNLAPILDANGWAVNAKTLINIAFGNTLTELASLPKNAKVNLNDPFVGKKRISTTVAVFIILIIAVGAYLLWKHRNELLYLIR